MPAPGREAGTPPGGTASRQGGAPGLRSDEPAPGVLRRAARILLAPLAALAAAVAGIVFVVLLPICGIASIASAVAQASWALVREALRPARRRAPRRG